MARLLSPVASILLLLSLHSTAQQNQLQIYPLPPESPLATDFRVLINGQEVPLYHTEVAAIANFSFKGSVEVKIQPQIDVKWVDLRPKSTGVKPVIRPDNTVEFRLDRPGHFSIEFNNEHERVLHLFANPPERSRPNPGLMRGHYFEAGKIHRVGFLDLRSGDEVYIEGGAIVSGGIRAKDTRNIRISGRGILDLTDYRAPAGHKQRAVYLEQSNGISVDGITIVNSPSWTVEAKNVRGLNINNLKIVNWETGSDGVDLVATSEVSIKNTFIRANDDCIAVKTGGDDWRKSRGPNVEHILVENSSFWNMPWGNALEIGFELRADYVENITFRDLDIIRVERGAAISIHNANEATVRNITYSDIRIEDAQHKLIDLAIFYSKFSVDFPHGDEAYYTARYLHGAWDNVMELSEVEKEEHARHRGHIYKINFQNIAVVDGPVPFSIISGFDAEHEVSDVSLTNLSYYGRPVRNAEQGKFFIENATGITFR